MKPSRRSDNGGFGKCGDFGSFRLAFRGEFDGKVPSLVFKSDATGLTIAMHRILGPVVNGYVALATETLDDDGLPHTLEHLVFMGSDAYPWKGVLDHLANRSFASGTNAWTAQDHTAFTMKTAGSEGFCNLLPVYLDHIFFPTLKDSAFLTEVHHVNGNGEDGGIVYSEMQSFENTASTLIHRAMKRAMYPGQTGYNADTGGALKNLRDSVSNEKVKAYHAAFYRPENVWIVIAGDVAPKDVMRSIKSFDKKLAAKRSRAPFVRPWSSPVPPLEERTELSVQFPSNEEDNGAVDVGWRGPSLTKSKDGLRKLFALGLLMDYLTDTAISPVRKAFVEIDSPVASRVAVDIMDYADTSLVFVFHDVPVEKLREVAPKLCEVLNSVDESTFDASRMKTLLHRTKQDFLLALESEPSTVVANETISHMLYGSSLGEMKSRLNRIKMLDSFESEDPAFWVGLLRKYLDPNLPHVVVRGSPSIELKKLNAEREEKRLATQKARLGREGLRRKQKELRDAVAENEVFKILDVDEGDLLLLKILSEL